MDGWRGCGWISLGKGGLQQQRNPEQSTRACVSAGRKGSRAGVDGGNWREKEDCESVCVEREIGGGLAITEDSPVSSVGVEVLDERHGRAL
jgi:hypothetical protein